MNERIEYLLKKANSLPQEPGVYLMKDNKGKIIYIGKAKILKNRVTSYFRKNSSHTAKVRKMVENVYDFDFITVKSEFEALVLENSLIKQNQPKYNILLKDDKGYSYIRISGDVYPRITAEYKNDDIRSFYLGPYTSSYYVKMAVDEVNKVFKLPTCNKHFPRDFKKSRPCLNKYINNCMGVCEGRISSDEYANIINNAKRFLTGDKNIISDLNEQMQSASNELRFEDAARYRDQIKAIESIASKQLVVGKNDESSDYIGLSQSSEMVSVAVMMYRDGKLIDKKNYFLGDVYDTHEMRSDFLIRYYENNDIPSKIYLDEEIEDMELLSKYLTDKRGKKASVVVPKIGEKLKLVTLAKANAGEYLALRIGRTAKELTALEQLGEILGLSKPPKIIESYDISNFGTSGIVAGMVVYENGRPKKKYYRKFAIKGISTPDDYYSMQEVITRRFTHYLDGDEAFSFKPDLILVDGGKGQVKSAKMALGSLGITDIAVFGMVKDNKHRTRAITDSGAEISIVDKRQVFTLVSSIQEEVHRFAITYQKTTRKTDYRSKLTDVEGIGEKKAKLLVKVFKTKTALKNAKVEELMRTAKVNKEVATALKQYIVDNF